MREECDLTSLPLRVTALHAHEVPLLAIPTMLSPAVALLESLHANPVPFQGLVRPAAFQRIHSFGGRTTPLFGALARSVFPKEVMPSNLIFNIR
jgi:hypothetical protein